MLSQLLASQARYEESIKGMGRQLESIKKIFKPAVEFEIDPVRSTTVDCESPVNKNEDVVVDYESPEDKEDDILMDEVVQQSTDATRISRGDEVDLAVDLSSVEDMPLPLLGRNKLPPLPVLNIGGHTKTMQLASIGGMISVWFL